MLRFAPALALLLLLTAGVLHAFAASTAKDFELKDLDGKKVSLKKLLKDNKLVVIDFWQVGCKPCNELLPHLQDYHDEYKKKGVSVVIISRDTSLTQAQVEPFFTSNKYTFQVLLDGDQEVSKNFGVQASPATFIITPKKEIILSHYGYKPGQEKEIHEAIEGYISKQ